MERGRKSNLRESQYFGIRCSSLPMKGRELKRTDELLQYFQFYDTDLQSPQLLRGGTQMAWKEQVHTE